MTGGLPDTVSYLPGFDPADSELCSGWHEGASMAGRPFRSPKLTAAGAARVADRVRAAGLEARRERSLSQVVAALAAAGLVGGVIIAMYLPIFDMAGNIKSG